MESVNNVSSNRIIGFHLTGKRRGRGGGLRRGEGEGFHDIVLEETFNAIRDKNKIKILSEKQTKNIII